MIEEILQKNFVMNILALSQRNEGTVAFCLVVWNDRARKYDKR